MGRVLESYEAHTKKVDNKGELLSAEITYVVFDAQGEDDALNSVLASAPEQYGNAFLASVEIESRDNDTTYRVNAVYEKGSGSTASSDEESEPELSFDCSTTSYLRKEAIEQVIAYTDPEAREVAQKIGTKIGWNGKDGAESVIEGVEVPTAMIRETYTRVLPFSELTTSFRRTIAKMTGKVNNSSFHGWDAGEVMFLGASFSGAINNSALITVSYHFQIQLNESSAQVAGKNIGLLRGFAYAWTITRSALGLSGDGPAVICKTLANNLANLNELGV